MARSCAVRTFWETLPTDFFSSPKRFVQVSKSRSIKTFHLSPMRVRVVSTGQAGSSAFLLISLIFVSLQFCKMLYSRHTMHCSYIFHLALLGASVCVLHEICLWHYYKAREKIWQGEVFNSHRQVTIPQYCAYFTSCSMRITIKASRNIL